MDVLSLIGIIMAFVAIIGGNYLEGATSVRWPTARRR